MKKVFLTILALALILTILPMPGGHDHAHAAGSPCAVDGCTCTSYESKYVGFGTTCKCGHLKKYHCDNHNPEYQTTIPPTCMKVGYDLEYCSACKKAYRTNVVAIKPDAHNFVEGFCTNKDKDDNPCTAHQCKWKNGVCVRVAGCTEKHAHTDDNFKLDQTSVVEPTCNRVGSYDMVCDVCGEVKHVDGTEKNPSNHSWKPDGTCANGCAAKCEHKTYVDNKCTVCGCPDHEHPDEAFTDKLETTATCVKGATYTRTYACGATTTITGEVDPNAHTWAPDGSGKCVNDGCNMACPHNEWVEGKCTACTYECPHTDTTQNNTLDATCKNVGSADMICDKCGEVAETVELPIDPDAHGWIEFSFGAGFCKYCSKVSTDDSLFEDETTDAPTAKPTCPENDHEWVKFSFGGWYCYKCGTTATDIKPLDPKICDHADTYLETVEAATCKTDGVAKEICDICETVVDDNVVLPKDPDAHDWIEFSFGAGFCRLCYHISVDDSLFEEPEDPRDTCEHAWTQVTNSGWFCYKCGGITTDENVVNPPAEEPEEPKEPCDHEWAKFSFGGWYCYKCGATATDIKPLDPEICDHEDTYIDVITPATCKTPGVGNKMCDICESLLEENVEIPVDTENGHKWTTDAEGKEYCELCGEAAPEKPVETPCDHDWIQVTNSGWFCPKCGEVTLEDPNARVPGDANDDGVFSLADILLCMQKNSGWDVEINEFNADVNADGVFSLADILLMQQKNSGWDVTLQ